MLNNLAIADAESSDELRSLGDISLEIDSRLEVSIHCLSSGVMYAAVSNFSAT